MNAPTPFKHLFVDDRWIAATYGVHRRIGKFEKHPSNPLLEPNKPWEGNSIYCFGTAIDEGDRLRLWYQVYNEAEEDPRFRSAVGYAESADGAVWNKPLVGAVHPRFGTTNLVVLCQGAATLFAPSVVRDDADPDPARRFKMMVWDAMATESLATLGSPFPTCPTVPGWRGIPGEGLFVMTSPDGIRWSQKPQPVIGTPSDAAAMTRLTDGRFLAAFKTSIREDRHFRVIAESESTDFEFWTEPRVVLEPDWRDPPGTEFYGLSPFEYFGNRLGLLWVYHNSPDDKRMDVQLVAWQADTGWHRAADRMSLLDTGPRGAWDAGSVIPSSTPLWTNRVSIGIWLLYGGFNVRHDDSRYSRVCIGQGILPLDGFTAMEAGHFPGTLLTRPVTARGGLRINGDARHGTIRARFRSPGSGAIIAESTVFMGESSLSKRVDCPSASSLAGDGRVQIEFLLHRAALYAFWFES